MRASPHSPRRQRKALYTARSFERRRRMTVPLSRELKRRFRARAVPVRKGDTVRVLSGSYVGREERVARVDRRSYAVVLDNITVKTGEEKLRPLPIRTSHLVITRLNLSDAWRRRALQVADEDVTPEERGEPVEPEEAPAPATSPAAPEPEAEPEPPSPAAAADDPGPMPPPRRTRKASKDADREEEAP
jgi:large subunit ribosomal protein L24